MTTSDQTTPADDTTEDVEGHMRRAQDDQTDDAAGPAMRRAQDDQDDDVAGHRIR